MLAETLYDKANNIDQFNNKNGTDAKYTIEETTLTGVSNYKKRMIASTEW